MSYEILTDSCANLTDAQIDACGVNIMSLMFTMGGKEYYSYIKGQKSDLKQFYTKMRNKEMVTTSQINRDTCIDAFEGFLKEGKDVLYIAFSSGLSGTYQAAHLAAEDLAEKYPERSIKVVDSLCASMGQGLLVWYACMQRKEGKSMEEVVQWLEKNRLRLCHWFTVDDLFFLKRGGRVSSATAVIGTLLGVKPVLHVDDEGHLIMMGKARGRKKALEALVEHMEQTVENPQEQVVFVSHGDCEEDAEYVAQLVKEKWKVKDIVINYIDPVIGGHSGPGTVALFFLGSKR